MKKFGIALALLMLAERAWKQWMVLRFFRRPIPVSETTPDLVSILQPILSGDPTLPGCLEHNLAFESSYALEYLWLVDEDDLPGQQICRELIARYPGRDVRLVLLPPPGERQNPKLVKLTAGAQLARGDAICILDDDTLLPDGGLERCLPFLQRAEVGVAFGLPYYVNFSNLWSKLVSFFVNSQSLLTYVPYTALTKPFTLNGMFYAMRREALERVGGFAGLEQTLADDFAVARRFRAHGYRLEQTPLCHGISTTVNGPRHYLSLIQRWFVFPRESLMRHLGWRERLVLYGLGLAPALFPLALFLWLLAHPSRKTLAYTLLYFGYSFGIYAQLSKRYLPGTPPWYRSWWVPVLQVLFPLQLLIALLSPQRINWRGHIMQAEHGGTFRLVRRRSMHG